jgi:hypothetical protein
MWDSLRCMHGVVVELLSIQKVDSFVQRKKSKEFYEKRLIVTCIEFIMAFEDYSKPKARKRKLRKEAVTEHGERKRNSGLLDLRLFMNNGMGIIRK